MAFLDYFNNNNNQEQYVAEPPAYTGETDGLKYGSKPSSCDKPKPCNPCPPKPCEPCKPPKPHCEPQPQPPKPCCVPCPPRPPKPCPRPCPKPLPCRKPCDPCAPPPPPHDGDQEVGWDRDTEPDSDCHRPCPPEPVCIYNACSLVLWVSLNLLFSAFSLVFAVSQTTVNVLNVIFIALNIGISFLGLAGLYNNCHDYIQLAAWWQWIAVPVSILLAYQTLIAGGLADLLTFLADSGFPGAEALAEFLLSLPTSLLNLLVAAIFVFYVAATIFFAFQWAEAACARCVIVDCDSDCGWFKTIIELIGSLLPVPVSLISQVFTVLASLCPTNGGNESSSKSAPIGYGSYEPAGEKAV